MSGILAVLAGATLGYVSVRVLAYVVLPIVALLVYLEQADRAPAEPVRRSFFASESLPLTFTQPGNGNDPSRARHSLSYSQFVNRNSGV